MLIIRKVKRKGKGEELLRTWYGRLTRNGQKIIVKLDIGPIAGTIPTTPSGSWDRQGKGDAEFERSRAAAEKAFAKLSGEDSKRKRSLRQLDAARRVLTGGAPVRAPLSTLYRRWLENGKSIPTSEIRLGIVETTFRQFAAFAAAQALKDGTSCASLDDVTRKMARSYLAKLQAKYAWETAKSRFHIMSAAWRDLVGEYNRDKPNPFNIGLRGEGKGKKRIPHRPLSPAQLRRLFSIVQERRPSLYPLVACAATTALRLGDAVSLKWENIIRDKSGRFICVDTATTKTGVEVNPPIIEPFASVLMELDAKRDDRDTYLFPALRERYASATLRTGLIREIKPYIALALMDGEDTDVEEANEPKTLEETLQLVDAAQFAPGKTTRLREVARQHFAGFMAKAIAANIGTSKAQISADLQTLEELTGDRMRGKWSGRNELGMSRRKLIERTREGRMPGRQASATYGWHSFRTSYITFALESGVELAKVQKIAGHSSVQMTLDYFRSADGKDAEEVRKRLEPIFTSDKPALPVLSLEDQVATLSEDAKKELARKLLGL